MTSSDTQNPRLTRDTEVLVVDDDGLLLSTVSLLLQQFGYKVHTAADGIMALQFFEVQVPDIVLSDMQMPGMSGAELLATVRRQFPAMRRIAMSSTFRGDVSPADIHAHALYRKDQDILELITIFQRLSHSE